MALYCIQMKQGQTDDGVGSVPDSGIFPEVVWAVDVFQGWALYPNELCTGGILLYSFFCYQLLCTQMLYIRFFYQ